MGSWCNTAQTFKDHATGEYTCKDQISIKAATAGDVYECNETASCAWSGGWKDAGFCSEPGGQITMTGVHPSKHFGYFDGSCDRIKWNNTFDRSSWCLAGSAFSFLK